MASERRLERLKNLFREELSKILAREIEFPENMLVTITRVEISPDIRQATAFITALDGKVENALDLLGKKYILYSTAG